MFQDKNARNNALHSIQENTAKVKNEMKKANQYEEELQQEEKVLHPRWQLTVKIVVEYLFY